MVYCIHFHSIMNYGLIFWGNSSHSTEIFKIQKYIVRIMTGCRSRDMYRDLSETKNSTSLLTIHTITSLFVVDQILRSIT